MLVPYSIPFTMKIHTDQLLLNQGIIKPLKPINKPIHVLKITNQITKLPCNNQGLTLYPPSHNKHCIIQQGRQLAES